MKRGQITLFIIIGIIILMIVGLFLYIRKEQALKRVEIARPKIVKVPEEVEPINEFVLTCLYELAKDGIKKLGDHGGYVNVKELTYYPLFSTKGDAVQFSPGSELVTAYWWHMSSDDDCRQNCRFETKRVPLRKEQGFPSFESQIDDYVKENLEECLNGFEKFEKFGFIVEPRGTPKVETTITPEDVFITLEYPLRITRGETSHDIKNFVAELDVKLKNIYDLATRITNAQIQHTYLERVTRTIIDLFSGLDSKALPPTSELEITLSPGTYWIKHSVKEKLKQLLQIYIPFIQVWGVRNYNYALAPRGFHDEKFFEVTYNRQFLLPLNVTYPELEARLQYFDWWEPYFDLNCHGELCEPDQFSMFFPFSLGMKRYEFAYDVSFPVLVEISQPSAFKGEGYSFKFFLEANLRNNQPFKIGTKLYSTGRPELMLFCNPNQRTSGNITILVQDGVTGLGVDEAIVYYACADARCNMGVTKNGTFASKFPRCLGGLLTIRKPGYASTTTVLDTDTSENFTITITLEPFRKLDFSIKQWCLTKPSTWAQWRLDQALGLLKPKKNQSIIITLTRKQDAYSEPFVAFAEIPLGKQTAQNISIVPGKYDVKITTLLYENVTIPVSQRCTRFRKKWYHVKKTKKCFYVPEEPIVFNEENPFFYGGAEFEWEITSNDLAGAKEIEFRQIVLGLDRLEPEERIVEDLSQMSKIKAYSKAYAHLLKPVIK